MTDLLSKATEARARMISRTGTNVVIYRENPLFEYFSNDQRADSVFLKEGTASLVGMREIDPSFVSLDAEEFCLARPYYEFRKGRPCTFGSSEWFEYPLHDERSFIGSQKKKIGELIDSVVSGLSVDDTESKLSELITERLCGSGLSMYYDPIVAFDGNTVNVWNKPGDATLKKIMYIEVAAKSRGLTLLYSNSFLATSDEEYVEKYRQSIEVQEIVKKAFVEGNTTEHLYDELSKYRGNNLYLTTPLFPYSYHPIPGTNEVIKTGDIAVFDLWLSAGEFDFRRKVVAVAGSYRASIV